MATSFYFQMGFLLATILMISSMMASFMGGWFSDRFGRRACIITWQTLALFCCIATYFAPNKWILYAARGGIGFANGLYYPIISKFFVRKRSIFHRITNLIHFRTPIRRVRVRDGS